MAPLGYGSKMRMTAQAAQEDEDRLVARLRRNLVRPRPPRGDSRGDHDLNPHMPRGRVLVPAAVLVPVIAAGPGPNVIFTKRAAGLADHAGEISFPGGRIEPGDADPVAAALRESEEELGLPPSCIEILGFLDLYETRTGFRVAPVVGLLTRPFELRPDPREVAEVLEVPFAHLLDPVNYRRHEAEAGGIKRHFHAVPYGGHVIWGATAGMLMNLREIMGAE
jgi:8-oxo-dGTP pyrophosphatase MutT (NUDIX family)